MTWLTLRLQRGELILLLGLVIAIAIPFILTADEARMSRQDSSVANCPGDVVTADGSATCQYTPGYFYQQVRWAVSGFVAVPVIVAILLAVPVVMELQSLSYRLAWTQSQTRWQWARARLVVLLVGGLAVTASAIALIRWWPDQFYYFWGTENFDVQGIVNVGWFVFAAGLILAIGTLLRRPLIALALGTIGYGLTRIIWIETIRPRLITPQQADLPATGFLNGNPWVIDQWNFRADGTRLDGREFAQICSFDPMFESGLSEIEFQERAEAASDVYRSCLDTNGLMTHYTYQPDSRFWPLQYVETGLLATIGLALIIWTVWYWLRRLE